MQQLFATASNYSVAFAILSPGTVEWLAKQRTGASKAHLSGGSNREVAHSARQLLSLPDEEFKAGFQVVAAAVRIKWIVAKGLLIALGVAAFLLIYEQITGFVSKHGGGQ
ncbi:hypothetical protein B5P45_02995 [Phyllobacterium zundukense]|uniref:Uncharacterized protein n=1 Tax=Phyllobacterium zundukense TaxID=1867719 RepID=A0A2N9W4W2_9HYPH|nr:hypothetical protein BLM14_09080 [Phyllobacterium zundukense]PIO46780.1 hypothetical protein B5P45_02995 [Phyllobacterium zundukense]